MPPPISTIHIREVFTLTGQAEEYDLQIIERNTLPSILNAAEQNELLYAMAQRYRDHFISSREAAERMRLFYVNGKLSTHTVTHFVSCLNHPNSCERVLAEPTPEQRARVCLSPSTTQISNTPVANAIQNFLINGILDPNHFQDIYRAILQEYDRRVQAREIPEIPRGSDQINRSYIVSASDIPLLRNIRFGSIENRARFIQGLFEAIYDHVTAQISQDLSIASNPSPQIIERMINRNLPGSSFIDRRNAEGQIRHCLIVDGAFYTAQDVDDRALAPFRIEVEDFTNIAPQVRAAPRPTY